MANSASREVGAVGYRLAASQVTNAHETPANDPCDATEEVELELRAAWQERLSAADRYVQIARAVIDELGWRNSAAPMRRVKPLRDER